MNQPLDLQRSAWNDWNVEARRDAVLADVSQDQLDCLHRWLNGSAGLSILDVGCGNGWTCKSLAQYGHVTGTDLADAAIEKAKRLVPEGRFIAGDFMDLDFGGEKFDRIVSLEVLSHVANQRAFVRKLEGLLKPDGELLLGTQNRTVLERNASIPPSPPGRIRNWVDWHGLRLLLEPYFVIEEKTTLTPKGHLGFLRYANSFKLESLMNALIGVRAWKRAREKLGCGWTLMVRGTLRPPIVVKGTGK